jgi:hypothetical protein
MQCTQVIFFVRMNILEVVYVQLFTIPYALFVYAFYAALCTVDAVR